MENKVKTVAVFSGYYLPFLGGIERYTDKMTADLVKRGYRVVIVTTNHGDLPIIDEDKGRKIYRLPTKNIVKQRYPIINKNREYNTLMKYVSDENIDFVICNTRFQLTTLEGLSFAKNHHLPSIVLDHGSSHFSVNNRFLDFFGAIYEHLLTARVKHYHPDFYAVSKRSVEWLKHFNIEAKGVIYNSVSESLGSDFAGTAYLEKSADDIFITYAGRIIKEKGIELLLEAFSMSQYSENVYLQIAGDGPELAHLKEKYQSKQINFLGKLNFEQTMSLMAQTDIFVYPSMYPEGLPTSILEAGLLSSAIIATDRGGTVEVIDSPELGIIMEENTQSLHESLDLLVKDKALREKLQQNIAKRIKEHFTWEKTVEKLDYIIQKN
ncbi:TPA: glycosyltransferase family 4 protein [Streptococcus agalactiae]|nr:glycosyltransferase family 4 protein [Streptococcus agalactiae]